MERPNTAQKHDKQEVVSGSYFRNNSNNSKGEKPKTSETKMSHHVLGGKQNVSTSYYE